MRKKRNPRKRTGTSVKLLSTLILVALTSIGAAPKKKPALDTYALVSGSVFDDRGYAFAGADATIEPEAQPSNKTKPIEAVSDARGEFVVRVPPGPVHYTVTVHAKGYQIQRKSVSVEDQERVEVTFSLERESK
jgi:Carboxypeptidase regulatory-like domain